MTNPSYGTDPIVFGSFVLDPVTGSLRKDGVRLRLSRQPARILAILAQRSGTVVSREELREQIWGNETFVDFEHGLNAAINKLRQTLGDSAEKPRFIETLPGLGYRFMAAVQIQARGGSVEEVEVARNSDELQTDDPVPASTPGAGRKKHSRLLLAAGGLLLTLTSVGAWGVLSRDPPPRPLPPVKFAIPAPDGFAFQPAGSRQSFAISPEGSRIAFTALGDDGELRLWLRNLGDLEAREIAGARGLTTVFWSPDGGALYIGHGRSLRRLAMTPGAAWHVISELPRRVPPTGTFLSPDRILLSNRQVTAIVPAMGGRSRPETETYLWPQMLPDGKHLLYLVYDSRIQRFRLRVGRFNKPTTSKELLETDSRVTWVKSTHRAGASFLLYVRAGTLLAQPFDMRGLRLSGEPVAIASDVHVFQPTGAADFAVSENGVLVYQPLQRRSKIAWLDRSGRELEQIVPEDLATMYVRASRDGSKIAASVHNPEKTSTEIWVYDTLTKVSRVVVTGPGVMDKPVWSPDGLRVLYGGASGRGPILRIRSLEEPDRDVTLPETGFQLPSDWSLNGRFALFHTENITDGDFGVVDLQTNRLHWLLNSSSHEFGPVFSPDGRWIAFLSNDSGRLEAYAQQFESGGTPRLIGGRIRISSAGAQLIRWRGDGKEICYLGLDGMVYSVPIRGGPRFSFPTPLFRIPVTSRAVLPTGFGFDVSSDGQRFLVPVVREPLHSHLVVIQGWESLLLPK